MTDPTTTFGWDGLDSALAGRTGFSAKAGKIRVLDSHTVGEPTRVVVAGGPDLGEGTVAERAHRMRTEHDDVRALLVNEPRGNPATVGVILGRPQHPEALTQAIYFNNVGYLTMCVHATVGLIHTLAKAIDLPRGAHRIETPAGLVQATLEDDGSVSVENVASYRHREAVRVETERHGTVTGDVAYGGNWFFITPDPEDRIGPEELNRLRAFCWDVRHSLRRAGITGRDELEVDHVYVTGTPSAAGAHQRNYVLCPGGAHDRSPCGTGTSANVACLAADGKLDEGSVWNQESCIGSVFAARYRRGPRNSVVPTVNGRAYLTGETTILLEAEDPFPRGVVE